MNLLATKKFLLGASGLLTLTAHFGMEEDWKHPKPGHEYLGLYLRQWWLKLSEGKTVSKVFHLKNKEAKRELDVYINTRRLNFQPTTAYLGVKLDRTLSYWQHLAGLRDKVMERSALIHKLVGTGWGASPSTLRTSALAIFSQILLKSIITGLLERSLKVSMNRYR